MNIDFSMARTRHLNWKFRLRRYLDGREEALEVSKAVSPRQCDLGKWLYAEGMGKYGAVDDMRRLELAHAQMHEAVGRVITAKDNGDMATAERGMGEVSRLSTEVIRLLTAVERAI